VEKDEKAKLLKVVERRREEIVGFLQTLIRIPSITGEEKPCAEFISAYLRQMGWEVQWHEAEENRPNVIAVLKGRSRGPSILLNDHMDVVPPGPEQEWKVEPFSGIIREGKIYGRGAADSKSGLTTMMMAVSALIESGLPWAGEIILSAVVDEEKGGQKGICYLIEKGILKKADMGLVLEPTTMRVEIAQKGAFWTRIRTYGRSSHGARPWLGVNAIDQMMKVIGELKKIETLLQERRHPLLHPPSINVGTIQGGTIVNMVPSQCTAEVDRRLLPGESIEEARAEMNHFIKTLAEEKGIRVTWEEIRYWPSMAIDEEEAVVRSLCKSYFEVFGREPEIAGKDACTDASWIDQGLGIPVAIFSPGDGMAALTANESVEIEPLIAAVKVVALFLGDQLIDD
jgi:acetylornithine deacetylase/succinyl-diaminopimelate desuccinylase family protein